MNEHLTSRQIDEYVAGAASAAAAAMSEEHIRGCALCRGEAERLSDVLSLFRQSVRRWSLEREQSPLRARPRRALFPERLAFQRLGWTAALAACLIAGLTLPRHKAVERASARQAISDADLLVQVDRELAEAVPPSMEPIALQTISGKQNEVQK